MRKNTLLAAILIAPTILSGTGTALAHNPGGQGAGGTGYWTMGPGMMGPGLGTGQGMMMAPGGMGPGYGALPSGGVDLSADDVRANLERWLAWHGNPRVKIGEVMEQDDDVVIGEIVTQDGSLVDRFRIDRHTGAMWRMR